MRHHHQLCTGINGHFQRGQCRNNTGVINNHALFYGNVQILTYQYAFSFQIHILHAFNFFRRCVHVSIRIELIDRIGYIQHTVGVCPFIVKPGKDLDQMLPADPCLAQINNGRARVVIKIA